MKEERSPVLLVEDDPNDITLIRRAFRKAGVANPLYVVEDGQDAIAYLAGRGEYGNRNRYPLPVVLLLDLKLPRTSGYEVLAWLRSQSGLNRVPAVILTSSHHDTDVDRAYELGANSYLVKPLTFDGLVDMVKVFNSYWLVFNRKPEVKNG